MKGEGLFPNTITYLCIVKACGVIGVVDKGKQIQEEVVNRGFLEKDIVLGTAFIDMYAKCGDVTNAHKFLEQLPVRNVVSWSALISGYAQQCQAREALKCFEQMQREGLSPNDVTFLSVLTACSHSGLLDNAQSLYMNMTKTYGIIPNSEHQTCMVVALGSVGHFDKVISLIKLMPSLDYSSVWLAVLGACSKWGNVKLAVLVFDQAIQLDSDCALAYVLMSSIFVAAGRQEDADKVEAMRLKYTSCRMDATRTCKSTDSNKFGSPWECVRLEHAA
jgi:pentatricopeptide repeat protein